LQGERRGAKQSSEIVTETADTSSNYLTLKKAVTMLHEVCTVSSLLKGELKFAWIDIPLQRMIIFALTECAYSLLNGASSLGEDEQTSSNEKCLAVLVADTQNLMEIPDNLVTGKMVRELAAMVNGMCKDHKGNMLAASGGLLLGAVKSVVLMKPTPELWEGLWKTASAAFDMYRNYKDEEKMRIMFSLVHTRISSPFMSVEYAELVAISKKFTSVDSNWFLAASYMNSLLSIAYGAIKTFFKADQSRRAECIRIINAVMIGNGSVTGIGSIIRKLQRQRSSTSAVGNSFLNAEIFTQILQNQANEAVSETVECFEKFSSLQPLGVIRQKFEKYIELGDRLLSSRKPDTWKQTLTEILDDITSILSIQLVDAVNTAHRGVEKVITHMNSLTAALTVIHSYIGMFNYAPLSASDAKEIETILRSIWTRKKPEGATELSRFWIQVDAALSSKGKTLSSYIGIIAILLEHVTEALKIGAATLKNEVLESLSSAAQFLDSTSKQITKIRGSVSSIGSISFPFTAGKLSSLNINKPELDRFFDALQPLKMDPVHQQASVLQFFGDIMGRLLVQFANIPDWIDNGLQLDKIVNLPYVNRIQGQGLKESLGKGFSIIASECKSSIQHADWLKKVSAVWDGFDCNNVLSNKGIARNVVKFGREALATLCGPSDRPDLLEEAAVIVLLEIHTIGKATLAANKDRSNDGLLNLFEMTVNSMDKLLAQEKTMTSCNVVKSLLAESKYSAQISAAVCSQWQSIEEEVMTTHQARLGVLRDVETHLLSEAASSSSSFSSVDPALLDTVHAAMTGSKAEDALDSTLEGARILSAGRGGVSGLAPSITRHCQRLRAEVIKTKTKIRQHIINADPRTVDDLLTEQFCPYDICETAQMKNLRGVVAISRSVCGGGGSAAAATAPQTTTSTSSTTTEEGGIATAHRSNNDERAAEGRDAAARPTRLSAEEATVQLLAMVRTEVKLLNRSVTSLHGDIRSRTQVANIQHKKEIDLLHALLAKRCSNADGMTSATTMLSNNSPRRPNTQKPSSGNHRPAVEYSESPPNEAYLRSESELATPLLTAQRSRPGSAAAAFGASSNFGSGVKDDNGRGVPIGKEKRFLSPAPGFDGFVDAEIWNHRK
jgi:hypothetical protein